VTTRELPGRQTGRPGAFHDRWPYATTSSALAFTPDSTTLIAATYDRRLIAWNLSPRAAAESACQRLGRDPELAAAEALVPGTSYRQLCPAHT
jgi:hypothetical protein